jgi:4-hydroxyphenylpyruvate dioxygenase
VRVALEFRGRSTFCSCLSTAAALVRACGEPNVGVCLDVFHYYTGPSKFEDLGLLDRTNLFHVQVCDVAGVPRELATDGDRIMPGEGDFMLGPIVERLRAIGYDGWVSLELFNPVLWQAKAHQVAQLGMQALERLLK